MDAKTINRMLEARVRDLAARGSGPDRTQNRLDLLRALGLDPLPRRTPLNARITGILKRKGYRIEKLRYESVPGLLVTAHLYIPNGKGPFPVILSPHGHFEFKKIQPWIQARGISLALEGFATLIVDSPGRSWDRNNYNERFDIGEHDDFFLNMGRCIQGIYAWDLMRGLDYLESRSEFDCKRVGITGCSGGGTASMYTFAIDDRITCAVPVCYASSLEVDPNNGCVCAHVPGVLGLGDRSDILALRAPAPIMIIGATADDEYTVAGHQKCYDKLRSIYKSKKAESRVQLEIFETPHDYNRRMREAMVAFFREHLLGEARRSHVPEKRPMTDGICNPYEQGTEPVDDPRLMVTTWFERQTKTFRDLLVESLSDPTLMPFHKDDRFVRWGRYGKLEKVATTGSIALSDDELQVDSIDQRACIYLGLSVPEVLAQILHSTLPGGPDGWESAGVASLTGDAITSMIASVKTLVSTSNPETPLTSVTAQGPVSSMTALFLKLYRPDLHVETSHTLKGWSDALELDIRQLAQPGARYLAWPF